MECLDPHGHGQQLHIYCQSAETLNFHCDRVQIQYQEAALILVFVPLQGRTDCLPRQKWSNVVKHEFGSTQN